MRIVGGRLGGRRLETLPTKSTRPSSERLRAGLASALLSRDLVVDRDVLDLYAGSGALGFELLSRGARSLVFAERSGAAVRCIERNAGALAVADLVRVQRLDLSKQAAAATLAALPQAPFPLAVCDPPYAETAQACVLLERLCVAEGLSAGGFVALEHPARDVPQLEQPFELAASYRYGGSAVSLWQRIA